jgi:hypothetical protein
MPLFFFLSGLLSYDIFMLNQETLTTWGTRSMCLHPKDTNVHFLSPMWSHGMLNL